jgi:hypothetical protein
MGGINHKI